MTRMSCRSPCGRSTFAISCRSTSRTWSPKDIAGHQIRIIGSTINEDVVKALGGTPVGEYEDGVAGGESAFDRAYSLPEPGTFTGNVTLYPKA